MGGARMTGVIRPPSRLMVTLRFPFARYAGRLDGKPAQVIDGSPDPAGTKGRSVTQREVFFVMLERGQGEPIAGSPEWPASCRRAVPRPSGRLGLLRCVGPEGYEAVR
jgi:hypothetical protein